MSCVDPAALPIHEVRTRGHFMDIDRFAALENDLNREFGNKKDWHHYFQVFQTWVERHVLQGVRKLAAEGAS